MINNELVRRSFRFATIAGISFIALTGCGTSGNGASVEKCGTGEGTDIEATFAGDKDYVKSTDPAVLANFSANTSGIYVEDPEAKPGPLVSGDEVDVVGEVACQNGEKTVLSVTGAQVQQLYIEKSPKN